MNDLSQSICLHEVTGTSTKVPLTPGAGGLGDRTLNLGRGALGTGSVSVIDSFSMNTSLPWVSVSACLKE